MKQPKVFPHEHRAAGLVFRVHLAPQKVVLKDGSTTQYESFLLQYYDAGKRVQVRRNTWPAIASLIEEIVVAHRQQDPERLELTGRDRRLYLAAVETLKPLGLEVDRVAQDYAAAAAQLQPHGLDLRQAVHTLVEALDQLGGRPLAEAVGFFKRHGASSLVVRSVPDVVAELVANVKADGRGDYHVRDLEGRLGRFAVDFPGPIQPITEAEITHWLQALDRRTQAGEALGQRVSPRTRNNYRDAIAELFAFARKRGYLPRELPTAGESTVRVTVTPAENHTITPAQLRQMLAAAPVHLIVPLVLKAFCG